MSAFPTLFVSHGAPSLVAEQGPARDFLCALGAELPRPRAIVVVSAHWETVAPTVGGAAAFDTIHDFYGFPEPLYRLRYPASGDPTLAERVAALIDAAGFAGRIDARRGLDHGAWAPLMLMYPQADIPVVPLSIQSQAGAAHHYRLGEALAPLRDEGVLVLASGSATHNLRAIGDGAPPAWAEAFSAWLAARLAAGDVNALLDYRRRAPEAVRTHPTDEHLLPLFVALGAAGGAAGERLHHSYTWGSIAMDAYRFH